VVRNGDGIVNVQFNVMPDTGMVQFNNILIDRSRKGFRFRDVQFNNVLVINKEGDREREERVGVSDDEWKKFLIDMVTGCNTCTQRMKRLQHTRPMQPSSRLSIERRLNGCIQIAEVSIQVKSSAGS
jgi:hypothetical protein